MPKETVIALEWSDAKRKIADGFQGSFPVDIRANRAAKTDIFESENVHFRGYTNADARRWFERGFSIDGIDLQNPPIPIRERRRLQYLEEGEEIHVDMVLSGEDNVFSEWTKREVIPGLAIEIEMGFRGSVAANTISNYFAFVCRAVYALETAGIDCEITLTQSSERMIARSPNTLTKVVVIVKRENEALDFASWSCLVSPAGKRTFTFALQTLACESVGEGIHDGYGASTSPRFGVNYSQETGVLRFTTDATGRTFPEDRMQEELASALRELSKS